MKCGGLGDLLKKRLESPMNEAFSVLTGLLLIIAHSFRAARSAILLDDRLGSCWPPLFDHYADYLRPSTTSKFVAMSSAYVSEALKAISIHLAENLLLLSPAKITVFDQDIVTDVIDRHLTWKIVVEFAITIFRSLPRGQERLHERAKYMDGLLFIVAEELEARISWKITLDQFMIDD